MSTPALPDGLVIVVKHECETCRLVVPVISQLKAGAIPVTVYTQDDPSFPAGVGAIHDADQAVSWHNDVETVPTVIKVENGREVARTIGWVRDEWHAITGRGVLGLDLPAVRPGCGSLSVDPDLVDSLRARFSGSALSARRVETAAAEDV
ncbi:MAG: hypothetical protein RL413_1816, partial [Actinomycetota bacterium]